MLNEDSAEPRRIRVALKYCGSCNPEIDLSTLGSEVRRMVADDPDFDQVQLDGGNADIVVILCGCPRACADRDDVKSLARSDVVISGEGLKGTRVPEKDLAAALALELEFIAANLDD